MDVTLDTFTFFARDVDALAGFYADTLGLAATVDDSPRYRELSDGVARIGFAFPDAYQLLDLEEEAAASGLRSIVTFRLPDSDAVAQVIAKAVLAGAAVAKPPYATRFGQWMAVLRDPEGNAFHAPT